MINFRGSINVEHPGAAILATAVVQKRGASSNSLLIPRDQSFVLRDFLTCLFFRKIQPK
jgi:hypothetical protein